MSTPARWNTPAWTALSPWSGVSCSPMTLWSFCLVSLCTGVTPPHIVPHQPNHHLCWSSEDVVIQVDICPALGESEESLLVKAKTEKGNCIHDWFSDTGTASLFSLCSVP